MLDASPGLVLATFDLAAIRRTRIGQHDDAAVGIDGD
jgi:hypothetical protein